MDQRLTFQKGKLQKHILSIGHGHPTISARIFLARHGETEWITGGKFASRTDVPLSRMGGRDVELIRQRLVAEDEMIDPTGIA